ncbi:Uncharacterized protein TCM_039858 [Theobroma cacao]|uniref:Uncharacterized protein n=1 Tax=Theobroma cacao TaxID=3641 RepID=A0A061GSW4_THECC|nr:Uncharacterized protein TCM_039858 [Theobroma cacao]
METTRTYRYGFGTHVPVTTVLNSTHNNATTSESTCGTNISNAIDTAIGLEEKVKNISQDLGKIREDIHDEIKENNVNMMAKMKEVTTKSMKEFMTRIEAMISYGIRLINHIGIGLGFAYGAYKYLSPLFLIYKLPLPSISNSANAILQMLEF